MSKRLKLLLICALSAVAALCVFSGCNLTNTVEGIISTKHLDAQVTYFANGGVFEDDRNSQKTLYYNAGTLPLDIGEKTTGSMSGSMGSTQITAGRFSVEYSGYNLTGWFPVEVNEDGIPLYEDGSLYNESEGVIKEFKLSEEQYKFDERLEKDDHIYLCAKWYADVKLRIYLVGGEGLTSVTITDPITQEAKTCEVGEEISSYDFSPDVKEPTALASATSNNTADFVAYYKDEDCTEQYNSWPAKREDTDTVIYAKFIKRIGSRKWTIVKDASSARNMLNNLMGNYYLINDIDCTGVTLTSVSSYTSCVIRGNGYTISNLTVTPTASIRSSNVSLFGQFSSTTDISDFKIDNLVCNYSFLNEKSTAEVYLVFDKAPEDGAKIKNVTVNGTLNIITNGGTLVNGQGHNVCFGGYADDGEYTDIKCDVQLNVK